VFDVIRLDIVSTRVAH